MTILDFVDKNGDIAYYVSGVSSLHSKVLTQALRHTTRSEMDELHKIARPNEDDIFIKWRENNKRHLTVDFIGQFVRSMQRTVQTTIKTDFEYDDLDRLIFEELIPLSVQDTNALVIEWPFYTDTEGNEVAPSDSSLQANQRIDSRTLTVYSPAIIEDDGMVVVFYLDDVEFEKQTRKRFVGIDNYAYYILTPYRDKNRMIKYSAEVWYVHGLGYTPVGRLPGIVTLHFIDGYPVKYRESICWPAFEWFDEGIVRLSSEQVAAIKHANPKLILNADIECPSCHGSNHIGGKQCTTCNGKGTINVLGDFSNVKVNQGISEFDKSGSNPVYYLEPPSGLKELREAWMEFFENGKKSLATDLLEGTGNESGVAKEMRLEPKQDLLKAYGQYLCYLIEDIVNHRKILRGETDIISVTCPAYFETKSPEVLKQQMAEALPGERFMKYMQYVDTIYNGNDLAIKIHKYAALYTPLMLYKSEEFDSVFNAGAYSEKDIVKRDLAIYVMTQIFEFEPDLDDLKLIKEKADEYLIANGFIPAPSKIGDIDITNG